MKTPETTMQNTTPSQKKDQTLSKSKSKDTKMMGKGLTQKEKMVYGINRTKETGGHKKRDTHTKKERGGDREKTGNPEIVRNTSKHRELNTKYWVEEVGGIGGIL